MTKFQITRDGETYGEPFEKLETALDACCQLANEQPERSWDVKSQRSRGNGRSCGMTIAKNQPVRIAFRDVSIGQYFYSGVGFHIKRTDRTADYFGLSQRSNRTGVAHDPDELVTVTVRTGEGGKNCDH